MTSHVFIGIALLVFSLGALAWCLLNGNPQWFGWLLSVVAACALLFVSGCSTIDKNTLPPIDWPELRVVVHKTGFMAKRECDGFIGGCSVPDFCKRTCDVYLQIDSRLIEDHEKQHCLGYDHPGDDTMKSLWEGYKRMYGPEFCALRVWR